MGLADLSFIQAVSLALAAVLTGMRRGGIQGAAILAVAIIGSAFEPVLGVGLAVVIFLTADIQAVVVFMKQVDGKLLGRLLLPAFAGIGAAAVLGPYLPEDLLGWILFAIILTSFGGMLWQRHHDIDISAGSAVVPASLIFGFLSGFTSMIGNLASIFAAIYFAMVKSSKAGFIATSAWFFFLINLVKLPVHLFVWRTLDGRSVLTAVVFLPLVTAGILIGRFITRRLDEEQYGNFIVVMVSRGIVRYLAGLLAGA